MKHYNRLLIWLMTAFTIASYGQQTQQTPTLEQLTRIHQQQVNAAFLEKEVEECDSLTIELRNALQLSELESLELRNALGAQKIVSKFHKEDAKTNAEMYEKQVKKASRNAFFAWLTPISLAIGFILGVSL